MMEKLYRYVVKVGNDKESEVYLQTNDVDELYAKIKEYTKIRIPKQYYWRILDYDSYAWIDYGSWTDFVFVYFASNDAKEKFYEYKLDLKDE